MEGFGAGANARQFRSWWDAIDAWCLVGAGPVAACLGALVDDDAAVQGPRQPGALISLLECDQVLAEQAQRVAVCEVFLLAGR